MTTDCDLLEALVAKVGARIERDEEHPDRPITAIDFFDCCNVVDATLSRIYGLTMLKRLDVGACKITDAWLRHLSSFPALEEFMATDTPITDAGLKYIGSVGPLKVLDLGSIAQASDEGIRALANLSNLEWLEVSALKDTFTSEGIASLKVLPRLRHLGMEMNEFTSDWSIHFRDFPSLESLSLFCHRTVDEALAPVGELGRLKKFRIIADGLTAGCLAHISRLNNLEELTIDDINVPLTDGTLFQLAGLSKLKVLSIDARSLTDSGIAFLAAFSELEELELQFFEPSGKAHERPGVQALKEALPRLRVS